MTNSFDIIVVGAGHAGVEASLVGARLGLKVALVTNSLDKVAFMSCNPSIGGLAKGHMVREIDVLGGEMGVAADATTILFKRLNAKKGPAVRGSRSQCDKDLYSQHMFNVVNTQENITLVESEVKKMIIENGTCKGVILSDESQIKSKTVILTAGTFMHGVMHIGDQKIEGGRVGEKATKGLSEQFRDFDFSVTRLKTGTPPRLLRQSIDWEKTTPQYGDEHFFPFSFRSDRKLKLPQIACYMTHTNEKTHEIIRNNLDKSPMFSGEIVGLGPRYCPSIEDKITRFAEKQSHLSFLEPEGLNTDSIYLQGISTSLPEDVQYEFLKTIPGLEDVKILRPGYAVEYDFFEPRQIWATLETRSINNLFFAGQINGTSGYEEAGVQGLLAGINASMKILNKSEFILRRDQAYMGVLVDDLVTKGTSEPYRMMTSRAEHRLVLREDNVIERLGQLSYDLGLINAEQFSSLERRAESRVKLLDQLKGTQIVPKPATQEILKNLNTTVLQKPISLAELLRRKEISCSDLSVFNLDLPEDEQVVEAVEIEVKYEGYIKRQEEFIHQSSKMENLNLPQSLEYGDIRGLSLEEVEKLNMIKPRTLGQAQRISGVNPSAIQAVLVYIKAFKKSSEKQKR